MNKIYSSTSSTWAWQADSVLVSMHRLDAMGGFNE